jgi:SAM-dependent methyltransferase
VDLSYYQDLLLQETRLGAFRRAIAAVVRPGDRVLDVGAGVGTYAFFAAEAGASAVWAVDRNPVIHVAADVARVNGLADRVRCVRGVVPDTAPSEPVDVVIYEDFSPRLLDPRVWRLYRDLQQHCARPDARWIPARGRLLLALSDQDLTPVPDGATHGIDWGALAPYLHNLPRHVGAASPAALVSAGAACLAVEFATPVAGWPRAGGARLTALRGGTVRALALWHVLELGGGELLDNAPGAPMASWGQLLLPLPAPIAVQPGEVVEAGLTWTPGFDGAPDWLGWTVTHAGRTVAGHEFAGFAAGRSDVVAGSPDVRPVPSARTAFAQEVLALVDGRRSAWDIAGVLVARYPAWDGPRLTARVLAALDAVGATRAGNEVAS